MSAETQLALHEATCGTPWELIGIAFLAGLALGAFLIILLWD